MLMDSRRPSPSFSLVNKAAAIPTLVAPMARPYKQTFTLDPDPSNPTVHVIDLSWAARVYKLLLQGGHHVFATHSIDVVPGSETFALAFAEALWDETNLAGSLVDVACGGGAFVVTELVERLRVGGSARVKDVGKVFDAGARARIKEAKPKGMDVLLAKLESA